MWMHLVITPIKSQMCTHTAEPSGAAAAAALLGCEADCIAHTGSTVMQAPPVGGGFLVQQKVAKRSAVTSQLLHGLRSSSGAGSSMVTGQKLMQSWTQPLWLKLPAGLSGLRRRALHAGRGREADRKSKVICHDTS